MLEGPTSHGWLLRDVKHSLWQANMSSAQRLTVKFLVRVTHIRLMLTLSSSPLNRTMMRYSRSCRQSRSTCSAGGQHCGVCSIEQTYTLQLQLQSAELQAQQAVGVLMCWPKRYTWSTMLSAEAVLGGIMQ